VGPLWDSPSVYIPYKSDVHACCVLSMKLFSTTVSRTAASLGAQVPFWKFVLAQALAWTHLDDAAMPGTGAVFFPLCTHGGQI
jgi:hypothetical protein